jgi:uncharacterized Ntn-hydrolase superfamily protein
MSRKQLQKLQQTINKTYIKLKFLKKNQGYPSQVKAAYWTDGFYDWHPCAACGYTKLTSWQAENFQGNKAWLCEDCKEEWEKQQDSSEELRLGGHQRQKPRQTQIQLILNRG